jgi:hypothetical protein
VVGRVDIGIFGGVRGGDGAGGAGGELGISEGSVERAEGMVVRLDFAGGGGGGAIRALKSFSVTNSGFAAN